MSLVDDNPQTISTGDRCVTVVEDKKYKGTWRVEEINAKTGDCEVAIFSGPQAERRARQFYHLLQVLDVN